MSGKTSLDALRREIDDIDDTLHDLLMRRTKVVSRVCEAKRDQAIKIRPARECLILYRLMERHKGIFPRRELARIWREMIAATLSVEGPFSVGVHMPETDDPDRTYGGRWGTARDQYGSFTPMNAWPSARRLINAVRGQQVTVGVLAVPERNDKTPWWPHLAGTAKDTPRIIARLPFIGAPDDKGANEPMLAICPVPSEPTGQDRTCLVVESTDEIGLQRLVTTCQKVHLKTTFTATWHDPEVASRYLQLAEVDGFVSDGDGKMLALAELLGGSVSSIMTIGSYGLPLDLGPSE